MLVMQYSELLGRRERADTEFSTHLDTPSISLFMSIFEAYEFRLLHCGVSHWRRIAMQKCRPPPSQGLCTRKAQQLQHTCVLLTGYRARAKLTPASNARHPLLRNVPPLVCVLSVRTPSFSMPPPHFFHRFHVPGYGPPSVKSEFGGACQLCPSQSKARIPRPPPSFGHLRLVTAIFAAVVLLNKLCISHTLLYNLLVAASRWAVGLQPGWGGGEPPPPLFPWTRITTGSDRACIKEAVMATAQHVTSFSRLAHRI